MKKAITLILLIVSVTLLAFSLIKDDPAVDFLEALDQDQLKKTVHQFDDESKTYWHFFPGSMVPRTGLSLAELNTQQRSLLNTLLQSSLSKSGYDKAHKIMDLENVMLAISNDSVKRDSKKYYVAFYGNPKNDTLWAWSFEGHHLSFNFTTLDEKVSFAPRFMGASPAKILSGPRKGERTLHKEEDLGFKLINLLSAEQKEIAIFQQAALPEIVTFNAIKVDPLDPKGIRFGDLTHDQQQVFIELIREYLSTMKKEQATKRLEEIKQNELDDIRFGWAGALEAGIGHYYVIQGKSFIIEFDNTQGNANHIHSVWRDFDGDFGRDLIQEHYKNAAHHN